MGIMIKNCPAMGEDANRVLNSYIHASCEQFSGRNSQSITVVFPKENYKMGDFVNVKITSCTSGTLIGEAVGLSEMN